MCIRDRLSRYPRPERLIFDNGSEFKKDFLILCREYGISPRLTTVKNPQSNSVLERVHQVLGNMLRTKNIKSLDLDINDPWSEILASIAWAVRTTHHTTLGASPAQLVYGRDMIYPLQYITEWDIIRKRKQALIKKSNARENKARIPHQYTVGDLILLSSDDIRRKLDSPTTGPYKITKVHENGTVTVQKGIISDRINIRRVKPYYE